MIRCGSVLATDYADHTDQERIEFVFFFIRAIRVIRGQYLLLAFLNSQEMSRPTIRLTMAQALVRYLAAQRVRIDGEPVPLFAGVFVLI